MKNWRRASRCVETNCNQCVEVAHDEKSTYIQDSKNPEGGFLTVTKEAFSRFLEDWK